MESGRERETGRERRREMSKNEGESGRERAGESTGERERAWGRRRESGRESG